jgi:hypothetical protein
MVISFGKLEDPIHGFLPRSVQIMSEKIGNKK